MASLPKQYDIVVIGATGFTGALVAKYITSQSSETFRWAITGRSLSKLNALQQRLRTINSKRSPELEIVELETVALQTLASRTKVVINAISPYCVYSEPILAACVDSGTAYLDFCIETPWIRSMILEYHEKATETGARIIPAIGNSSSPSELVNWLIANSMSDQYGEIVDKITCSFDMKINGMSSGSLHTVTSLVDKYGIGFLWSPKRYALVPGRITRKGTHVPIVQRFSGYSHHAFSGRLTTSFATAGNVAVVQRSEHLNSYIYKQEFTYQEYMPAASFSTAGLIHFLTKLGILLLALPSFRSILDRMSKGSSSGPDAKAAEGEYNRLHAVGTSRNFKEPVHAVYEFHGGMYLHSAMLAVEAAMAMLEMPVHKKPGRFLAPSSVGISFVKRLRGAGVRYEVI